MADTASHSGAMKTKVVHLRPKRRRGGRDRLKQPGVPLRPQPAQGNPPKKPVDPHRGIFPGEKPGPPLQPEQKPGRIGVNPPEIRQRGPGEGTDPRVSKQFVRAARRRLRK